MNPVIDHRKILTLMDKSKEEILAQKAAYRFANWEREELLQLTYRKGDVVHDRVTGGRGTIAAGARKRVTKVSAPGD